MKMKKDHYKFLLNAILPLKDKLIIWKNDVLVTDIRVKDINKRLRWDALQATRLNTFVCDTLYSYLNDDHIDTALKSIMNELEIV